MDFLTAEEKDQLEAKLDSLRKRRSELVDRIAEARAKGDLKENAEYHAAREDHAMNERTIKELESRLKNAKITDSSSVPDDMVFVGATVKLRDVENGDEELYKLVGEAKVDFTQDYIEVSSNSPMGQSLMKARVGETVRVDLPRGTKQYEILEII